MRQHESPRRLFAEIAELERDVRLVERDGELRPERDTSRDAVRRHVAILRGDQRALEEKTAASVNVTETPAAVRMSRAIVKMITIPVAPILPLLPSARARSPCPRRSYRGSARASGTPSQIP